MPSINEMDMATKIEIIQPIGRTCTIYASQAIDVATSLL